MSFNLTRSILYGCLLLNVVGMIFYYAGHNEDDKATRWVQPFSLVVVILATYMFERAYLALGAAIVVLTLAVIDWNVTAIHQNSFLIPKIGAILITFSMLLSHVAFPLTMTKPDTHASISFGKVLAAAALFTGNILIWIAYGRLEIAQPMVLAFLYLAGNFWNMESARDLPALAAAVLLYTYWKQMVSATGLSFIGFLLITAALALIIIIRYAEGGPEIHHSHSHSHSHSHMGNHTAASAHKRNASWKDLSTIFVLIGFVAGLVGSILIWSNSDVGSAADWTAAFTVFIIVINVAIRLLGVNYLSFIAVALAFGLQENKSSWNFLDTLVGAADAFEGAACAGWALQFIGVVLSFFALREGVEVHFPALDAPGILSFILGCLLGIGNVFFWIKGSPVVSPALLGVLTIATHLWGMRHAYTMCFFLVAYSLVGWWALMSVYSGLVFIGALCLVSAAIGIIVHHVAHETSPEYTDIEITA